MTLDKPWLNASLAVDARVTLLLAIALRLWCGQHEDVRSSLLRIHGSTQLFV